MQFMIFCVVLVLTVSVQGSKEMMMKIMTECKTTVGATDEDVAKMMMHTPADNQQQKCLFNCIMSSLGVIKGGKLDKDGVTEMANKMTGGNAEMLKHAVEIFDDCSGITDADECEAAYKLGGCFQESGKKRGMMLGF